MFEYIHFFRGLAAVLVVLHHAAGISEKYLKEESFEHFFLFGRAGVDFFFVLSGFIIYFAHQGWVGRSAMLKEYLWRRFVRVYPVYWIVFAITLPLYFLLYKRVPNWDRLVLSFLLIRHEMVVYVAWTLVHEIYFYLMFCFFIFNKRIGLFCFFAWFLAIIFAAPTSIFHDKWFDVDANPFVSNYNILFFIGMFAAYMVVNKKRIFVDPLIVGWLGVVSFLFVGLCEEVLALDERMNAFYAVASFLIIYGFAAWEVSAKRAGMNRYLLLLGSASYSIYLVHSQVVSGVVKLFVAAGLVGVVNVLLVFLISAVVSIACGLAFYKFVEAPVVEYFKVRVFS